MREFSHFFLFYPNGSYSISVCIFLLESSEAEKSTWRRHFHELMESTSSLLALTARLIAYILTLNFDRLACRGFRTAAVSIGGNCGIPCKTTRKRENRLWNAKRNKPSKNVHVLMSPVQERVFAVSVSATTCNRESSLAAVSLKRLKPPMIGPLNISPG